MACLVQRIRWHPTQLPPLGHPLIKQIAHAFGTPTRCTLDLGSPPIGPHASALGGPASWQRPFQWLPSSRRLGTGHGRPSSRTNTHQHCAGGRCRCRCTAACAAAPSSGRAVQNTSATSRRSCCMLVIGCRPWRFCDLASGCPCAPPAEGACGPVLGLGPVPCSSALESTFTTTVSLRLCWLAASTGPPLGPVATSRSRLVACWSQCPGCLLAPHAASLCPGEHQRWCCALHPASALPVCPAYEVCMLRAANRDGTPYSYY